jgi:hypothetical protein
MTARRDCSGPLIRHNRQSALAIASTVLLVLWVGWWVGSVRRDRLKHASVTWVGALPFMTGDFKVHIDHVARTYASGVNPYRVAPADDWVCAQFPYPPMIPRLFAWVSLFSPSSAARIWLLGLTACLATGTFAAWKTRRALDLTPVPLAALGVAVAYSTPAVFAMERGQCDPLVLPAIAAASWLLGRRSVRSELAAGILLGAAAWLKYYPGLAVIGLISLRRWRALGAAMAVALLIGAVDWADVATSIENGRFLARLGVAPLGYIHPTSHSLVADWRSLWLVRWIRPLSAVPGVVGASAVLVSAVMVVSLQVWRAPNSRSLAFPLFAWLTAAATFAMPYSNDYNLVTLPVAALAVWDRRDRVWVHMAMGLLLLWWQPVMLSAGGGLLLTIKTGGLLAVGVSLCARAREVETDSSMPFSAEQGVQEGEGHSASPHFLVHHPSSLSDERGRADAFNERGFERS